jgi:predicted nucleic acid-binding protein
MWPRCAKWGGYDCRQYAARRLGLYVIGVVGILLEAKASGMIDAVRPHLRALRQTAGFYLSEPLHRHALALAGESDW